MKASPDRFIEIFNEAKALAPGNARARFLAEACGEDLELLEQVRSLLESHEDAGDFLERTPCLPPGLSPTEKPGDRIGRYKLLEQIGEGGFGVVYMAEQEEPVRRRVALKVIKLGMDTKAVMARFEAERQALAMMDHPNIAKVFDAGATDTGRPYFVMELVRGVRITDFCDQHELSTEDRLKLFTEVCHAIQHAHQKGIIHRDIKPSNILVTLTEPGATACPKVIDFGIAKATSDQRLTDKTIFTAFEQFMGTPAYMSPEQAMMTSMDVDTRADIYALGVLLYELLTGQTPFDSRELMAAGLDAMRRMIRETEPARPSTRLSAMGAADLTAVARHRRSEPTRLGSRLRGDLDWIVMKCLEKDRGRRYDTANGLALDIRRHLESEPVLACPPSAAYRFRKYARRNRVALAVASALGLAVFLALAGLAVSNRLVTRERDEKTAALSRVLQEKKRADQNLARAREAVKEYLLKTSENPLLQAGDFQPLRKELLETAIPFYEDFVAQDQDNPDLEFERGLAYDDLGFLREGVGDQEQAAADFEQAKEIFQSLVERFPDLPAYRQRLAEAHNSRGAVLKDLGQFDAAEQEYRLALELVEQLLTEPGSASEGLASQARIEGNLGNLLNASDRQSEAEGVLRHAIDTRQGLLARDPESLALRGQLATSWNTLGTVLTARRKSREAQEAFENSLQALDPEALKRAADDGPLLLRFQHLRAQAWNNLGTMHNAAARFADAEAAHREALGIREMLVKTFPSLPQHRQELASSYNNLGAVLSSLNRIDEARAMYEKAISLYERLSAESHEGAPYGILLAGTYSNLGRLIGDQGRLEESLTWLTKGVTILEEALQRDGRAAKVRETLCIASWTRAMTLCGLDRYADAVPDWDRAIEMDNGHHQINLRTKRASNLLNLKDHVRATADAAAIAESTTATAGDLYNAACIYALSSQLAMDDALRIESYRGKAVEILRQALAKGYQDLERIRMHGDLEALRSREDFQQLMKELDGGPRK